MTTTEFATRYGDKPYIQAIFVFGLAVFLILAERIFESLGLLAAAPLFPWLISSGMSLFYALMNSLLLLRTPNINTYFGISLASFVGLSVCTGLVAWFVSGVKVGDAETYKWIFVVVTFGYLVFLSMVQTMRRVADYAQEEDDKWNAQK